MKLSPSNHPKRQKWEKPFDFLFACAGYFVGLGNIWRFPYLCFENGGGAFLIPYLLSVALMGIPFIILETSFGQCCQSGIMKAWDKVPLFKGVAYAGVVCVFHSNVFYIVILSWISKYIVASFSSPLPWSVCGNPWNSDNCVEMNVRMNQTNLTVQLNATKGVSAAEEFWTKEVLGMSSGIDHIGSIRTDLLVNILLLWIGVYFATFKGIKWLSKVVYVTATLPILLIIVVVVRGCTLEGAYDGIYFYLVPDLTKLAKVEVWVSAATQVAYSTGIGLASLVLLGSYNQYHHNFFRDSILIGVINSMSSFVSGFAVFSSLGFMAKQLNTTVQEVAASGPGLVFIAFPQSISLLPFPQLWSSIFFITLLLLGFDSQFVMVECAVNFFIDGSARIRSYRWHREIMTAIVCVCTGLVGILMVTEGGIYFFEIYNAYAVAGWCIFLIAACEVIAIAWVYGLDLYFKEITKMIGSVKGKWWLTFCLKYLTPVLSLAIVGYFLAGFRPLKVGNYVFPLWAQCLGHLMSLSSVIFIPGYAIYIKLKTGKSFAELRRCVPPKKEKMCIEEEQYSLNSMDNRSESRSSV
ncbi:sodium- and chloride-dependent GABA transporter 1-like [Ciona intestinalis]